MGLVASGRAAPWLLHCALLGARPAGQLHGKEHGSAADPFPVRSRLAARVHRPGQGAPGRVHSGSTGNGTVTGIVASAAAKLLSKT